MFEYLEDIIVEASEDITNNKFNQYPVNGNLFKVDGKTNLELLEPEATVIFHRIVARMFTQSNVRKWILQLPLCS